MHDDNAKAVAEVATATGKLADLVEKVGSFCARFVGQAPEQIGGIATDWATYLRCNNLLKIQDKVEAKLQERALQGKTIPVKLRLAYPMVEAASLEEDETLQALWANLMTNAMDPQYAETIHPSYIDIIRQLSADEAKIVNELMTIQSYPTLFVMDTIVLQEAYAQAITYGKLDYSFKTFVEKLPIKYPARALAYLDNLFRLIILDCVTDEVSPQVFSPIQQEPNTQVRVNLVRAESIFVTEYGRGFIDACIR